MSAPDPLWVPVFTGFDALRKQYDASQFYADEEVCWRATNDTLLRRLQSGQLPARAARASLTWDDGMSIEELGESYPVGDGKVSIPEGFWQYLSKCPVVSREQDWLAGDFSFQFQDKSKGDFMVPTCSGHVIGLEIDANHLPQFNLPEGSAQSAGQSSGGRPAASWWPDFAEELAIYIHEHGIPEGQGHEGQSVLIDAVFARMAEQGKAEPGRGTVQPVVNAVLRRIRSAGN